ncbi:hypothetical protein [Chitinophaga defluvii]|uniref:Uncharacterized protein n=1 Tax=Chitinophaga defluvii TaxID=3163343 RepID=A0ABV2TCA6_9BACT
MQKKYYIRIYTRKITPKNLYALLVVYYDPDEGGTWRRRFKRLSVNTFDYLQRDMVCSEVTLMEKLWRLYHVAYTNWEGLISDEYGMTEDMEWCRKIHSFAKLSIPLEEILKKK